jgi:uncharacterized zinc-type alcohol dehydrogenase-like protein
MHSHGFAALAPGAEVSAYHFESRDLGPGDVVVDIEFCGICHSDLHVAANEWGITQYPVVLGHEIVGRVSALGDEVLTFSLGERVGVGCMIDSCQQCAPCSEGLEQYCDVGFTPTSGITHGGYANRIVVRKEFVLKVSETLDPARAAPLLCAGITTYSPLKHWGVGPGTKVGIVGLGGLGHIAVKLAHALGAHVTVFTSSASKASEARALGADEVVVGTSGERLSPQVKSIDLLLNTASASTDLEPYVQLLRRDGVMVMLGAAGTPPKFPAIYSLEYCRRSLAGSIIGGIPETQAMLDFCAQHQIGCDVEVINPDQINAAFMRLSRGDVRYRFVVDLRELARRAS